ncbi:MAG: glycosyltransferase family 39 protein [Patescibacteria group bacterium]
MNYFLQLLHFVLKNSLIVSIVLVAAILRFWQLDSQMILFPDAGHDLLVAAQAVEERSVPLLGIPSSIPIFKQGPIAIWLMMATISTFGIASYPIAILFALIGCLAVIGIYEILTVTMSRQHGLIAAALAATSPIMVAHSRMPYHTTPIPFMTILFLAACVALWHKYRFAPFLAVLTFCGVFQFELAAAPLALVPIYIWLRRYRRLPTRGESAQVVLAFLTGMLPQVIFDLQNNFTQIAKFFVWVMIKTKDFFVLGSSGNLQLHTAFENSWLYIGRIFSTDFLLISIAFTVVFVLGIFFAIHKAKTKILEPIWEISLLSMLVLLSAFIIHTGPSEAYFPPLFILVLIHITCTIKALPKPVYTLSVLAIALLMLTNVVSIWQHRFFVSTVQKWTYAPSLAEQRQVISFITQKSTGEYQLKSTQPNKEAFPSDFDNYRWVALEEKMHPPGDSGTVFWIQPKNQVSSFSPAQNRRTFQSLVIYWH